MKTTKRYCGDPSQTTPLVERRGPERTKRFRFTLGAKFILLMATLLSAALVTESISNYRFEKELLLQSLQEKAAVQGKFVSEISKEAILGNDYESLNRYMEETSRIQDIAFGVVISTRGQLLTSFLDSNKKAVKIAQQQVPHGTFAARIDVIQKNPHVLTYKFPIQVASEHIADFVLGVDTTRIETVLRTELLRQLASHAGVIFLLGLVVYFVFRNSLLVRIKALIAGASRVAQGNLNEPIVANSSDEICDLTHSFNRMMSQLRESNQRTASAMDEMRDLNRNLESRVQERTARLELALRIAQMGHWDYDVADRVFHISSSVRTLFGIAADRAVSRTMLLRAVHPDDRRDVWQKFTAALTKRQPLELEFRLAGDGESPRTLFASAERLMDESGQHLRLFGIVQDITARVLAEYAAHTALRETLDAKTASEAKSAFLANMSHEIRTPLTAIIGFAESMRDPAQPAAERQDSVNTIIDSGKHLLHVINEILDLSKIESRRLTVELIPTRVTDIISDVESVATMLANEKALTLAVDYTFPIPTTIHTDPTRLKQILLNLCGNAIKFTNTGGVRIRVHHAPEQKLLHFDIADTGIGIAPDKINRLFTPFEQADSSTTRRFGGTGLGLYISKQLAEMLGGTIEMKSTEGLGTLACVTIATGDIELDDMMTGVDDIAQVASQTPATASAVQLNGTVLLAEDNAINQRLIGRYIQRTGAKVETAENGQIAYEKAQKHPYDLILMDMQMPVLDGLSATRRLREMGYNEPIVALTANAFKEDRDQCRAAGCDDFLTKPIDLPEFYRVLNRYLPHDAPAAQKSAEEIAFDEEIKDLVKRFIDGLPEWQEKCREAHRLGALDELRTLTHQLKGLGGTFGYPDISHHAGAAEDCVRQHPETDMTALLAQLYEACDAAIAHFRKQNPIAA